MGCSYADLLNGKKAQATWIEGSPFSGFSYSVNVTCPEGSMLSGRYHWRQRFCERLRLTDDWRWTEGKLGCRSKLYEDFIVRRDLRKGFFSIIGKSKHYLGNQQVEIKSGVTPVVCD